MVVTRALGELYYDPYDYPVGEPGCRVLRAGGSVHRRIDRHLAFGYGTHFCIGAALARLEGVVARRETLRRFPAWEVDYDRLEWVHTSTVRGFAKVPIRT